MPTPGQQHGILRCRLPDGGAHSGGAISDVHDAGGAVRAAGPVQECGADRCGIFFVRIVVRDVNDVGQFGDRPAHLGALVHIALPGASGHHDELTAGGGAQRIDRQAQCRGIMRKINDDARRATHHFHTTGDLRCEPGAYYGANRTAVRPAFQHHGHGERGIGDIEISGQAGAHRHLPAVAMGQGEGGDGAALDIAHLVPTPPPKLRQHGEGHGGHLGFPSQAPTPLIINGNNRPP